MVEEEPGRWRCPVGKAETDHLMALLQVAQRDADLLDYMRRQA
jgi:hypothetical protein